MMKSSVRNAIVRYARLMAGNGYSVAQEGNISCRISRDRVLITPTNVLKSFLKTGDLVEIDLEGRVLRGRRKPTSERFTHLEIYRNNPETGAVVHAHPLFTVLCTVIGLDPLKKIFLSEAAMFLKNAVFAPYARPSTDEGAKVVRELCVKTNVIVIDRHGSFTCGRDLQAAFALLEILEKYCKMAFLAHGSGQPVKYLDAAEVEALGRIPY